MSDAQIISALLNLLLVWLVVGGTLGICVGSLKFSRPSISVGPILFSNRNSCTQRFNIEGLIESWVAWSFKTAPLSLILTVGIGLFLNI